MIIFLQILWTNLSLLVKVTKQHSISNCKVKTWMKKIWTKLFAKLHDFNQSYWTFLGLHAICYPENTLNTVMASAPIISNIFLYQNTCGIEHRNDVICRNIIDSANKNRLETWTYFFWVTFIWTSLRDSVNYVQPLSEYFETFWCFHKFSFHHKWNYAQLSLINVVYMNCLTSCGMT